MTLENPRFQQELHLQFCVSIVMLVFGGVGLFFFVPDCAGDSEISQGYVSSTVWAVGTWVSSSGPLRVFVWCEEDAVL